MNYLLRLVLLVVCSSPIVTAQTSQPESVPQELMPTVPGVPGGPPPLAADTGRMQPPYHDFSRYVTPGMCKTAAYRLDAYAWLVPWRDTNVFRAEGIKLIPSALDAARQCMAQFDVKTTAVHELRNLLELSILTQQDQLANAIIERRLALAPTLLDSGQVLKETVQAYLGTSPVQPDKAAAIAKRLDNLGPGVASHRLLTWSTISGFDAFVGWKVDPLPGYWEHAQPALQAMSQDARDEFASEISQLLSNAFNAGFWTDTVPRPDKIKALAHLRETHEQMNLREGRLYARLPDDPDQNSWFPKTSAPPMTGTHWFNHNGTVIPQSGKVTFLVSIPAFQGSIAYRWYAMIRRLRERYDTTQLDIVISSNTQGFDLSGVVSPEKEAESIRWYFLEYHKLPVKLLVHETPFDYRDDGRRLNGVVPFRGEYPYHWAIIDGHQIVRVGLPVNGWPFQLPDPVMKWHIERALRNLASD